MIVGADVAGNRYYVYVILRSENKPWDAGYSEGIRQLEMSYLAIKVEDWI